MNIKKRLLMITCFLTFTPFELAYAKPISYVGGTMVMWENDETSNILLGYTFSPRFAARPVCLFIPSASRN